MSRLLMPNLSTISAPLHSLYDRGLKPVPPRPTTGLRYRVETLLGITGVKMAKYRDSWLDVFCAPFNLVWRPHLLPLLLFEVSGHVYGGWAQRR